MRELALTIGQEDAAGRGAGQAQAVPGEACDGLGRPLAGARGARQLQQDP
ncbi:hypothetical protein [Streptomyces ochraceiscleroticus]|uniref:Uncharacterized protein n=1 Tax=Streptomyces ochraceiscleroticus TaxID=47761 RepID=A0ABW1MJI4_9ACTN|nr:hypothetical protein [Streptomyces ochraceiscleroticus]